ncbi:uncharacterized protein LOC141910121 [Tubulanus polymorphus]|uniref:uncharacterized protein LOC141910121 n=1 Tax=Tubulanus polymorphus TaxID=672921 RepID=UPI003DA544A6
MRRMSLFPSIALLMGLVWAASAQPATPDDTSFENEMATLFKDKTYLKQVEESLKSLHGSNDVQVTGDRCQCQRYRCGCCFHLQSKILHLNETDCANMTFNPNRDTLSFQFRVNGKLYINRTLDFHNPPPLCFAVVPVVVRWCAIFYDVQWSKGKVGACLKYQLRVLGKEVINVPIGCFYFPLPKQQELPATDEKKLQEADISANFWKHLTEELLKKQQRDQNEVTGKEVILSPFLLRDQQIPILVPRRLRKRSAAGGD